MAGDVQMEGSEAVVAKSDPPRAAAIRKTLDEDGARRKRRRRIVLGVVTLIVAVVSAAAFGREEIGPSYQTAPVERGDLSVTVSATGWLKARETVDVGAEVSGHVLAVHVDFNDRVKRGQLLADIDTARLEARVAEVQAQLAEAHAAAKARRLDAEHDGRERDRARKLSARGLVSEQRLAEAEHAAARSAAEHTSARARAGVVSATLQSARSDVERARIVAPIDGVVLERNVEAGQTLASSFQVPVLFKLARDLSEMELAISVDEADVGGVHVGQAASFTVEAFPTRSFDSKVIALRQSPSIEQGVVSYQAVLSVDNDERVLLPGMTATARIVTRELHDVLRVPNAALRFLPPDEAKKLRDDDDGDIRKSDEEPASRVWTLREGAPVALTIQVGKSDGRFTEVSGEAIEPGIELLVDVEDRHE
jgi:HlyD family secretion protein